MKPSIKTKYIKYANSANLEIQMYDDAIFTWVYEDLARLDTLFALFLTLFVLVSNKKNIKAVSRYEADIIFNKIFLIVASEFPTLGLPQLQKKC